MRKKLSLHRQFYCQIRKSKVVYDTYGCLELLLFIHDGGADALGWVILYSLSEKALMAWRNNCNRMALADLVIYSCVCIVYAVEILGAVISSTSLFHNTHPCVRQ